MKWLVRVRQRHWNKKQRFISRSKMFYLLHSDKISEPQNLATGFGNFLLWLKKYPFSLTQVCDTHVGMWNLPVYTFTRSRVKPVRPEGFYLGSVDGEGWVGARLWFFAVDLWFDATGMTRRLTFAEVHCERYWNLMLWNSYRMQNDYFFSYFCN